MHTTAAPVSDVGQWVDDAIQSTPVYDLHTHLYPPTFGPLMLWGIDELLTYHYLIGETMRTGNVPYERFWSINQRQQADLVWRTLFIEHAPISEACRGVLTVLHKLGLDVGERNLAAYRDYFKSQKPAGYVDTVFRAANVHTVVMTNDPMDDVERPFWLNRAERDPRFRGVLRIDPLLLGWPNVQAKLQSLGYDAADDLGAESMKEIRRYLNEWADRFGALYVAVSLPPTWRYPEEQMPTTKVLDEAVLPVCRERNIPFAVMIGVDRQANPALRLAGDALGKGDMTSLNRLCAQNPHNKFMATVLSRENQHELAVAARLQPNLFVFGCWWYMNNPSIIEEITRMRMELLGTDFAPQHSDARVLDQIVYKWDHSRAIIGKVLKDKFADIERAGWRVTRDEVNRTVKGFLSDNFANFLAARAR
jgi:hypothetical protein